MDTVKPEPRSFTEMRERLDQIVLEVRDKDIPLEKSLDLYEEAIRLGNRCSDLIDKADFSPEEMEALGLARDEAEAAVAGELSKSGVEVTSEQETSDDEAADTGEEAAEDAE